METDVALTRTPTASSSAKTKSADDAHLQEKKPNVNEGASESDLTGAGNSDAEKTEIAPINGDEHEHITGLNLLFVMATLALSCFLIMLDTSIISTVSPTSQTWHNAHNEPGR